MTGDVYQVADAVAGPGTRQSISAGGRGSEAEEGEHPGGFLEVVEGFVGIACYSLCSHEGEGQVGEGAHEGRGCRRSGWRTGHGRMSRRVTSGAIPLPQCPRAWVRTAHA